MPASAQTHLAIALDGAGWHPAAWREPAAEPKRLFEASYWAELAQEAQRGLVDFVTIEDSLALQTTGYGPPEARTDQVRGRLDALLIAARIAPVTSGIGLVPTVTTTHTEPFHVSKSLATLDYVSTGRAGWRVQVSTRPSEAEHFGRREFPQFTLADRAKPEIAAFIQSLFDEAADHIEAVRRLWDSWEDDAEIRDAATGRFVDRDKLHYIDFEGAQFSVKGPSITPRPPQGQPLVTLLGHQAMPYALAAGGADLMYITPKDEHQAASILAEARAAEATAGRTGEPLRVWGDLVVFLDDSAQAARDRKDRLDERSGSVYSSDAAIFAGTPVELADLLESWTAAGLEGFRLRPAVAPTDVQAITRGLVPELQRRGAFRTAYESSTLRGHLGLARPASRYVAA
ncbi:MAG: FMNH2-dependent monooxygenase [Pseudonocardiales bacterium]|nr:FMNH2-dependent monooxygenase [Jatrophihabitantaceae bacterium]MCW2603153.1 FMNH2-dependent monooxygenase [Pseudonocardiales bacterium]